MHDSAVFDREMIDEFPELADKLAAPGPPPTVHDTGAPHGRHAQPERPTPRRSGWNARRRHDVRLSTDIPRVQTGDFGASVPCQEYNGHLALAGRRSGSTAQIRRRPRHDGRRSTCRSPPETAVVGAVGSAVVQADPPLRWSPNRRGRGRYETRGPQLNQRTDEDVTMLLAVSRCEGILTTKPACRVATGRRPPRTSNLRGPIIQAPGGGEVTQSGGSNLMRQECIHPVKFADWKDETRSANWG